MPLTILGARDSAEERAIIPVPVAFCSSRLAFQMVYFACLYSSELWEHTEAWAVQEKMLRQLRVQKDCCRVTPGIRKGRSRTGQGPQLTVMPTAWRLCLCSGTQVAVAQSKSSILDGMTGHHIIPLLKPTLRQMCLGCHYLGHLLPEVLPRGWKKFMLQRNLKKLVLSAAS